MRATPDNTTHDLQLRPLLMRGVSGSLLLCVGAIAVGVVSTLLLARILKAEGFGAFSYAWTWVELLVVVAVFGLDKLLMRDVAIYQGQGDWQRLRSLLRTTQRGSLTLAVLLVGVAAMLILLLRPHLEPVLVSCLWVAIFIVPLRTLTVLRTASLLGLHRPVLGQVPQMLLQTPLTLAMVLAAWLLLGAQVPAPLAVALSAGAAAVVMAVSHVTLRRTLPAALHDAPPTDSPVRWLSAAWPLALLAGLTVINARTDVAMLGVLMQAQDVGIYAAATQVANLVGLGLVIVNPVMSPIVARLHREGDAAGLQRVVTLGARLGLLVSLPVAVAALAGGPWILALFGPTFPEGYGPLVILTLGQLLNVATGSVNHILIMSGHQGTAVKAFAAAAVLNVLLNLLLIPRMGLLGAATATTLSLLLWNVLLLGSVSKRLAIDPTALGIRRKRGTA